MRPLGSRQAATPMGLSHPAIKEITRTVFSCRPLRRGRDVAHLSHLFKAGIGAARMPAERQTPIFVRESALICSRLPRKNRGWGPEVGGRGESLPILEPFRDPRVTPPTGGWGLGVRENTRSSIPAPFQRCEKSPPQSGMRAGGPGPGGDWHRRAPARTPPHCPMATVSGG
jgi:hypothetical protein